MIIPHLTFIFYTSVTLNTHSNVYATLNPHGERVGSVSFVFTAAAWTLITTLLASILTIAIASKRKPWFDRLMSFYGLFIGHGSEEQGLPLSMKILAVTCLLFGFLCVQLVAGSLTAQLTVTLQAMRVSEPEDILRKGLNLYVLGQSAVADSYMVAKEGSVDRRIFEEKLRGRDPCVKISTILVALTLERTFLHVS